MHFKIQSNVFKYQSVNTKYPDLKVENFSFTFRLLGYPNSESQRETNFARFSSDQYLSDPLLKIPFSKKWARKFEIDEQTKKPIQVFYQSPCGEKIYNAVALAIFCKLT